jgi:hypothetical protein
MQACSMHKRMQWQSHSHSAREGITAG